MAKQRHLQNAPIIEAIIDFRTKLPAPFNVKEFLSLKEILHDRYPKVQERRIIKSEFKIQDGKHVSTTQKDEGIHGYFFKPEDGKRVAQFRFDGFTFSKLKPYTFWTEFVDEAKDLWKYFLEKAQPDIVNRIAVRYINRIDIPLPINDFKKYLTTPPSVPDNVIGNISGFLSKLVIHNPEIGISANITQALEKSAKPNYVTIILDIDVYKLGELDSYRGDLWTIFEKLHTLKNQIFFKSITEETARLFE